MPMIIQTQNFPMTDAIRAHLVKRLTHALQPFESRISTVDVFFKDLDGSSRNGVDKNVLIKIQLIGQGALVVEHASDDLYISITVAARRAKRVIKRALRREQRFERRKLQQEMFDITAGMAGTGG